VDKPRQTKIIANVAAIKIVEIKIKLKNFSSVVWKINKAGISVNPTILHWVE
jgi:hypothetical protein